MIFLVCLGVAAVGLLGLIVGLFVAPAATLDAYLGGFAFALSLAVGSMVVLLIAHLAGARWLILFRRLAEVLATAVLPLFVTFIPIWIWAGDLYLWARPLAEVPEHLHHAVEHKRAWLNLPFFVFRSILYFGIWIAAAELFLRFSLRQDPERPRTTNMLRATAGLFVWPIVLSVTFASIDWFMSLDPGWVSTMYPVYYFAGALLSALALLGVVPLPALSASHRHALGKLELTFVIFWAYVAFSQFMLIWIADLPHEVTWYLARMFGFWGAIGVLLILGHFAFPFLLLLSRKLKRRTTFLMALGAWLLFVHWIDVLWLVIPSTENTDIARHWWLQVAALFFFTGLTGAHTAWRARRHPLFATADPFFSQAERYETG